ncbi:hypothetical protein FOCC_FOCC000641 [Frankliniella occidentalis]|nr:hypothetical protein FOCC_FOCC000641 [Frankliniella occidentalis]
MSFFLPRTMAILDLKYRNMRTLYAEEVGSKSSRRQQQTSAQPNMRFGRRRIRLTGPDLLLGLFLGSIGGYYIWSPEFARLSKKIASKEELEAERSKTLAEFGDQSGPVKT